MLAELDFTMVYVDEIIWKRETSEEYRLHVNKVRGLLKKFPDFFLYI